MIHTDQPNSTLINNSSFALGTWIFEYDKFLGLPQLVRDMTAGCLLFGPYVSFGSSGYRGLVNNFTVTTPEDYQPIAAAYAADAVAAFACLLYEAMAGESSAVGSWIGMNDRFCPGAHHGRCSSKCWCSIPCPAGQHPYSPPSAGGRRRSNETNSYSHASACQGGGQPKCDLGYCAGQPNSGMLPCPRAGAYFQGELDLAKAACRADRDCYGISDYKSLGTTFNLCTLSTSPTYHVRLSVIGSRVYIRSQLPSPEAIFTLAQRESWQCDLTKWGQPRPFLYTGPINFSKRDSGLSEVWTTKPSASKNGVALLTVPSWSHHIIRLPTSPLL